MKYRIKSKEKKKNEIPNFIIIIIIRVDYAQQKQIKQTQGKWNSDLMNTQVNVKKISSSNKTANQKLIKHKQD
jgi:hypothetical protein